MAGSTSLSNFYAQYLINRGLVRSAELDSSISVFDYSTGSEHLEARTGKVGICLIPDTVPYLGTNDGQQIRRKNNTLYISGPFVSGILEEALKQASEMISEVKPAIAITINASLKISVAEHPTRALKPLSCTSSATITGLTTKDSTSILTASIHNLKVKTPTSPPLIKSSGLPTTLIVDDNAVNLRFLEMYCRNRLIPHLTATDGLQAVSAFSDRQNAAYARPCNDTPAPPPIQLILMDLQMPNCDGIQATRRIRELESSNGWSKSTIVMVTGQDSLQDRLGSKEAGADGYFVKPVGPKILDSGIKEWFPEANT